MNYQSGQEMSVGITMPVHSPFLVSSNAPNARSVAFCASVTPLIPVILSRS